MLEYDPNKRATAQEMLNSEWFNMPANFDYKMNDREYEKMKMTKEKSKIEKNLIMKKMLSIQMKI